MPFSYTDERIYFKPNNQESIFPLEIFTNDDDKTVIINALDITNFRTNFNDMVEVFDEADYTVNDMLRFYSRYDPNNAESYKTTNDTNDNYLVNQWKGDDDTPYRNILSDFILDMIINYIDITDVYLKESIISHLNESVRGKTQGLAQSSVGSARPNIQETLEVLIDGKLFNLYFSVIGVEIIGDNSGKDISLLNVYNTTNIIVMNILKYFYLSELLLRVLLDTNENVDASEDVKKNIIHSDYEVDSTEHLGMRLSDNEITEINVENKINEVNKILKDIYLIYLLFKKNKNKFNNFNQSDYGTGNGSNTDSGSILIANYSNQTDSLKNDVVDINMNINKLNLKNINIKKNYEKNRNIYFITILFVIVYISINLFVILTKGPDSLLTLNGIIIIVILLTKFSQAIMKVYQNLVKDLKN